MKCGHCELDHDSVSEVRRCWTEQSSSDGSQQRERPRNDPSRQRAKISKTEPDENDSYEVKPDPTDTSKWFALGSLEALERGMMRVMTEELTPKCPIECWYTKQEIDSCDDRVGRRWDNR